MSIINLLLWQCLNSVMVTSGILSSSMILGTGLVTSLMLSIVLVKEDLTFMFQPSRKDKTSSTPLGTANLYGRDLTITTEATVTNYPFIQSTTTSNLQTPFNSLF